MIGWRENYWNPERVSSVFTVCLCVCLCPGYRLHLLTLEPNFWNEWYLAHEKKHILSRNFLFRLFYWHWWRFWKPLITMFLMISRFLPDNKRFCYLPLFLMSDVRLLSCILSNENAKIQKVIQSGGTYANIKD